MNSKDLAIGVDCGGTNMKIALVRRSGDIVHSVLEPIHFDTLPEKVIIQIAQRIKKFLTRIKSSRIESIGMGIAGDVDPEKGVVRFSPNLKWKNVPLKAILSEELKTSVFVENDANCAAWGAYCLDAKRDCNNLICLTLGTGVGGGLVLNRKLFRGASGSAGEIGHMSIKYDGRMCRCGSYGCIESLIGAWGLIQTAETGLKKRLCPVLEKMMGKKGASLSARMIEEAARKNDPFCRQIWMDAGEHLGTALANLVNLFNPERIVLCGGLSKAGDLLLKPALHTMGARAFQTSAQVVKISLSKYDQQLGVAGAALLFWE